MENHVIEELSAFVDSWSGYVGTLHRYRCMN